MTTAAPDTHTPKRTLLCAAAMLTLASASAQTTGETDGEAWRFQLTPYVWMTGMEARIRPFPGAPTAHVGQRFSDIFDNLDAAAFLTGTARKGRYVFQGDASHAAISDSASLPLGLTTQARVRQDSLTLTGGYNWLNDGRNSLDLLAGARWWSIKTSVQLQPLLKTHASASFLDPIVAMRWRHQLGPRWSTLVYLDAGGLGIGSDFTWQLLGSVNYQLKDNLYVSLGYRRLSVDYRDQRKRLDFGMGGPMVGVTLRF